MRVAMQKQLFIFLFMKIREKESRLALLLHEPNVRQEPTLGFGNL